MPHNLPQQVSANQPEDIPTGQQQVTSTEYNVFDEIPQLEEEEDGKMAISQMQTQP